MRCTGLEWQAETSSPEKQIDLPVKVIRRSSLDTFILTGRCVIDRWPLGLKRRAPNVVMDLDSFGRTLLPHTKICCSVCQFVGLVTAVNTAADSRFLFHAYIQCQVPK